jgi:two-component system, OmpR family, phosphate regulon sensor histidine kinase PhoR
VRRLSVQLLAPVFAAVVAVAVVAAFYWSRAFERLYVQSLVQRLEREARLAADALPWEGRGAALDALCARHAREIGGRITVIAADGKVVGESEEASDALENHANRPEVLEARSRGVGTATRFSNTLGFDMLYVALADRRSEQLRFVRVALPLRELDATRAVVRRTLAYGIAAVFLFGGVSAWLVSRRIAGRIGRIEALSRDILAGTGDAPARIDGGDELGALEKHLVDLAREMRTQLARTEAERARLEAVLRNMVDGVVVLDRDGRILLCNRSAVEQLELGRIDAVGAKLSLVCRQPELTALVDEALRSSGAPLQQELDFPGRERHRVLSASAVAIEDEAEPLGAILVLHDLTRVRQFEAMRADFVANVSHELRTPLTAIRGYAETLQGGALRDAERAVEFVGVIQRHSERLTRLIDDLLTLSDLELGRTEIRPRPLPLADVVPGSLEMLKQKAEERHVELAADIPADLPAVLGDRDRLEQVLINLVDNAIKYSGSGSRVDVVARVLGDNGGRSVEIAVCDNGVGIPEKDVPRLTERFYRVDRARSRELGGTGLGLAIVKHIVQAHGGSLGIESAPGRGTTVRVTLPAAS